MKKKIKVKYFVAPILLVMSFSLSIVCAAFSQDMFISGEAYARINKNVRIMSISFEEGTNGGTQEANPKFNEITTITYSKLPNLNSTAKYKIKVRNNTSNYINVYDITDTIPQNSVFDYDLDLTSLDSTYHSDLLDPGTEAFIYLTIKYKEGATLPESEDDQKAIITNKYDFDAIYARELSYSNLTYTGCTDVQCALDDIRTMLGDSDLNSINKYSERFIKSHTNSMYLADDDPDHNLRYIGKNPNNYVYFNNQNWRIIGLFEGRLKIVSTYYYIAAYDITDYSINAGYGINEWSQADLMKILNPGFENNQGNRCISSFSTVDGIYYCGSNSSEDYDTILVNNSLFWTGQTGYAYSGRNCKVTNISANSALKDATSKSYIDDAVWYLGANPNTLYTPATAAQIYAYERGDYTTVSYTYSNTTVDSVPRTSRWTGKVGLIYPSDYVYATGGGSNYDRTTCLNSNFYYVSNDSVPNWNNTYTDCKNNNWIQKENNQYTMTRSFSSNGVTTINQNGFVGAHTASSAILSFPVVYLKPSVTFTGQGSGTSSDPYILHNISS